MRLTLSTRREISKETYSRYRKANRKGKSAILNEFAETCGYSRKYAAWLLGNWSKTVVSMSGGKITKYEVGSRARTSDSPRGGRPPLYDAKFCKTLARLWHFFDCLCGKRFAPFLRSTLPALVASGELTISAKVCDALMHISPASIDRLLTPERSRSTLRGISHTKPGTLLKKQIPIRTFGDWEPHMPGLVEIDLVCHEGGSSYGDFHCTLTMTDVNTGWTELIAVQNKAQTWVFDALRLGRSRFPYPIKAIDCDNGSEFINNHLFSYCLKEKIVFTRSRPYRKNDGCFVEQKNNSVVRHSVGYARFDNERSLDVLNQLYLRLCPLTNLFLPSTKLISKTRKGAQVKRIHDKPRPPLARVLESPLIPDETKTRLSNLLTQTNPAALMREELAHCSSRVEYVTRGQYIAFVSGRSRTLSGIPSS